MDQLLEAYQQNMIGINMIHGANNLGLENIKSTQLEQGQAIVSLGVMMMMKTNGIGVIAEMVIGTTNP